MFRLHLLRSRSSYNNIIRQRQIKVNFDTTNLYDNNFFSFLHIYNYTAIEHDRLDFIRKKRKCLSKVWLYTLMIVIKKNFSINLVPILIFMSTFCCWNMVNISQYLVELKSIGTMFRLGTYFKIILSANYIFCSKTNCLLKLGRRSSHTSSIKPQRIGFR